MISIVDDLIFFLHLLIRAVMGNKPKMLPYVCGSPLSDGQMDGRTDRHVVRVIRSSTSSVPVRLNCFLFNAHILLRRCRRVSFLFRAFGIRWRKCFAGC